MVEISQVEIDNLRLQLLPLIGVQLDILSIPIEVLSAFEPSQVGTIIGTLMDACIPHIEKIIPSNDLIKTIGISKAPGILKDREGYPDYLHASGKRLELKLLYVDANDGLLKVADTPREPSARLTQKVTVKNVVSSSDVLLVIAYQLRPKAQDPTKYSPEILNLEIFSMIECIRARDFRLLESGGKWFGDFETPVILSKSGKIKLQKGLALDMASYGRKEDEGKDFNEDTNFGKLKRIPYAPLQKFLKKVGCNYSKTGNYPTKWSI